jgi:phosphatidate cytidylyltransferase
MDLSSHRPCSAHKFPAQQLSPATATTGNIIPFPLGADFVLRTKYTFFLIIGATCIALSGHLNLIAGIAVVQICVFKEVLSMQGATDNSTTHHAKSLSWYIFVVTMYCLYGESLGYYFTTVLSNGSAMVQLAIGYHRFLGVMLYLASLIFFVLTARMGSLKAQIKHFALTHIGILIVVLPGHFAVEIILNGIIWFLLPVVLVATNDVFAYLFGKLFGRTQLIKLSPKKTMEGFFGAWLFTIASGFLTVKLLERHTYFTCEPNDLGTTFWSGIECTKNAVFMRQTYEINAFP